MQLNIAPARLDWLTALEESDESFTTRFGIRALSGWVGFPEALPAAVSAARRRDADPWGSYLFFDDELGLVGFGGFKGAPRDGGVEIGYAIAPEARNRGMASAAVARMIEIAKAAGVRHVLAHTLPEANASTTVLTRAGFSRVGIELDPDGGVDGEVWRWELDLDDAVDQQPPAAPTPTPTVRSGGRYSLRSMVVVGGRQVVLRQERAASGSSHLRAHVGEDGDLVIEGQDLGEMPERFWGAREYEWAITIAAESMPGLVAALGGDRDDDPLDLLATRYLEDERHATTAFLDEAGVSYKFWSRVGD